MHLLRNIGFRVVLLALYCAGTAAAQVAEGSTATLIVVADENGVAVSGARIEANEPGQPMAYLDSDFAGRAWFASHGKSAYSIRVVKPGFYLSQVSAVASGEPVVRVTLRHEQIVREEVSVTASLPGIDTQQTSDAFTLNLPEITNIPYETSRDIRNLLPFYPGVVQDATGQVHVNGSETWATLDTLDQFDIRSPVSGILAMRVSADAVRSIDQQSTRYPVQFGRATGGVVAFYAGMGDNKFRFNTTDFLPSFQEKNGIQFDKFVPRVTFSGPIVRDRAWYFDGLEMEYDNNYIQELPSGANTNHVIRGSNLGRFQFNATPANILSGGLLFNDYHSPYEGLSALTPQQSTTKRNTIAWLPYLRNQYSFGSGALVDIGVGMARFTDGYEPHGTSPFEMTPEQSRGSYFENLSSRSQRLEGNVALYLAPRHWMGLHSMKAGVDVDHIGFDEAVMRAPVNYLREDGTLSRQSTFPVFAPFTRHNMEVGAFVQDRWTPHQGLLLEPGVRFDVDEVVRRPEIAPRLAAVYAPPALRGKTKVSAGAGLYFEHTQLEYLERAFAGIREDTYFGADGTTPTGPPVQTTFTANYNGLHEARAVNWSVGLEQKLPLDLYISANLIRKRVGDEFTYADQTVSTAEYGDFTLTNGRTDHDNLVEVDARRTFANGYTLFAAYTHSSARTNAAIDYNPTNSLLGLQQSGPLPWDTPNRVISWGWVPFLVPLFRKNWDFVYTAEWRTGFPYAAVDANQQVVGAADAQRFPNYFSLSPGLEWRFHFRGSHFGLRGVIENISDSGNYFLVNNNVASPQFGTFSEPLGRALTARIRLIGSK